MATKPKPRKPTPAERATAEKLLDRLVANHSKEILNARDGEVKRKLVAEAFDYAIELHAYEVQS